MGRSLNSFPYNGNMNLNFSDEMHMPIRFESTYTAQGSGSTTIIELEGEEGELTATELALLTKNVNSLIKHNNKYYRLQLKNDQEFIFGNIDSNFAAQELIYINGVTGAWIHEVIHNIVLDEHIADTDSHIQAGERESWNNKLNYDFDGESENLILTRN